VQRAHRGAGFAPLALTLAASAALYWKCLSDIVVALEGKEAGAK
jgi:hypothetical protein